MRLLGLAERELAKIFAKKNYAKNCEFFFAILIHIFSSRCKAHAKRNQADTARASKNTKPNPNPKPNPNLNPDLIAPSTQKY
jgi:hypothetical protein